jgi:hypothetical protein
LSLCLAADEGDRLTADKAGAKVLADDGAAALTTVMSNSNMKVATATAITVHHLPSTRGRSVCHIGWVSFVTAMTQRGEGM